MFKSYRVGTLLGIPFKLDITFLLILPIFAWIIGIQVDVVVPMLNDAFGTSIDPEPLTGGMRPYLVGLAAALLLFACVTLHELGHSVAAMHYGYDIDSITLWLLGGIAKFSEFPRNWRHEFVIAIAGPIVNILILFVGVVLLLVMPPVDVLVFLVLYLAILNVALAAFNMLPAFPLDGGRVLRALLARNRSYLQATRQAAGVGKGFAILLGFLGLLMLDFILMAIALFVYIAATSETRHMMLDAAFDGVVIEDVMTPADELTTIEVDVPLEDFLDVMLEDRHVGYPVLDSGTFVGLVTLSDVQSTQRSNGVVAAAMTNTDDLETVGPDTPVMDAFQTLSQSNVGRLPVVDEEGSLVGLVTRTDLMRAFKIVMEQQRFEQQDIRGATRSRAP